MRSAEGGVDSPCVSMPNACKGRFWLMNCSCRVWASAALNCGVSGCRVHFCHAVLWKQCVKPTRFLRWELHVSCFQQLARDA